MSRGAFAYRDLDEEIFAPPEFTHHDQTRDGDACGGYYQSHSSPLQLSKASGHSEAAILRRHLALRRARRTKIVLVSGIVVMLVSTVLLLVLSRLPAADKSSLELVIGAPYGYLRRAGAATGGGALKNSASAPVGQDEAAEAMGTKTWSDVEGPGVGDDDPYGPEDTEMEATEAGEEGKEEEKDPYEPDEDEDDGEGVENEW